MRANTGIPVRSRSPADWLLATKRYESEGELLQAYDIARQGLAKYPNDLALKHRAVLCLASTQATSQAAELFTKVRLDLSDSELASLPPGLRMDIPCLNARIRKDEALTSSGEKRCAKLREAADLYESCFRREATASDPEAYYPATNAATLRLLAGDCEPAAELARQTVTWLEARPERQGYYDLVSAAEAHLVLGNLGRAGELIRGAREKIHGTAAADYRALAATIRQLRLVIDAKALDPSILSALAPPRVLHYSGHMIARPGMPGRFPADQEQRVREEIERKLQAANIGFGYGSLAAGADILFAEALLKQGVSLNVVLPFDRREFIEESVLPSGSTWVKRYKDCLVRATTVRYATKDSYLGDDQLFAYCSQLAMGLALLRARNLATEAEQIVIWDGEAQVGLAGTSVDVANWRRSGRPTTRIKVVGTGTGVDGANSAPRQVGGRRTRAMLFADIHGFSKMTDVQLPVFVEKVLGRLAAVLDPYEAEGDLLFANTWGDALYLVFDDAGKAAGCALELQEAMASIDLAAIGLPEYLALRIGGHLGPVYSAREPILKRDNYFGAHVSRAARIEPVTPEGCVYVTETLAAVLAIHNADQFQCHYVGMTRAAKRYGTMRMFLLHRARPWLRSARAPWRQR
jgi:class 3 adenylate cyclase